MGENSKIEWTDHTFNPWIGCTKVAAGCTHCYAESFAKRTGKARWGENGTRVKTTFDYWQKPFKWNADAQREGRRARVFCASMADVFEDWCGGILNSKGERLYICDQYHHGPFATLQPFSPGGWTCCNRVRGGTLGDLRKDLFLLIDSTPHLDWLLLTKRPENVRRMWQRNQNPPSCPVEFQRGDRFNVWLGTSISDQATAEEYWYGLQGAGGFARFLFLSIEPLLGPIDWRAFRNGPLPHWVIVGGESGHHSRPMHPDWVRALRDYFIGAGVPFFFKQWGEWAPGAGNGFTQWPEIDKGRPLLMPEHPGRSGHDSHQIMLHVGKKAAGRLLDGREWNEFPVQAVRAEA